MIAAASDAPRLEYFWDYIQAIRIAGYSTDPRQITAAQYAVLSCAVEASTSNLRRTLANQLTCIFAKSASEQDELREISILWAPRLLSAVLAHDSDLFPRVTVDENRNPTSLRLVWFGMLVFVVVTVGSVAFLSWDFTFEIKPSRTDQQIARPWFNFGEWFAVGQSELLVVLVLFGVVCALAGALYLRQRRNPRIGPSVEMEESGDHLEGEVDFDRIAFDMRRHRRQLPSEIDVGLTIEATVRAGGLVSLVPLQAPYTPTYVAIIEEFGPP